MIDNKKTFNDWKVELDAVTLSITAINDLRDYLPICLDMDVNSRLLHIETRLKNYRDLIKSMKFG